MNLLTPLPPSRWPESPLGEIMHELDLVRLYMRDYKVAAISWHLQDPDTFPKPGLSFEKWKEVKSYEYDYSGNAGVGDYRNIP